MQHLQSVVMMFEVGKPVLCEKPMTMSVKDTTTVIQAAREKGLFLMEVRISDKMQAYSMYKVHRLL